MGEYSYVTHCNIFPRNECPKRTDEGFRARIYDLHHKYYTPLVELPIDMIKDFPTSDSLHLIDLGIMKRCLVGWKDGTFRNFRMKWCAQDIANIGNFLLNCKMPSEIHRKVRGLDCLSHWKGLEYRTFFYYIGIVILKKYLPYDVYEHFLCLFCGITICSSLFYMKYINAAEQLLEHYVEMYRDIYGEEYITSNIHNILHIVDDVRNFGVLSTFSSYPFESKLYQIKNMLRRANNPLVQVAKRLTEQNKVECTQNSFKNNNTTYPIFRKQNDGHGINTTGLEADSNIKFFSKIETNNFMLSTEYKNKWFLTNNNQIICLKNIIVQNDIVTIYGSSLKYLNDFFVTPIRSSYLNIWSSNCQENKPQFYSLNEIKCKLVSIKQDNENAVFIPLLHTLN